MVSFEYSSTISTEDLEGTRAKSKGTGASSFAWLHRHAIFNQRMAASNALVFVGGRLFLSQRTLFCPLRCSGFACIHGASSRSRQSPGVSSLPAARAAREPRDGSYLTHPKAVRSADGFEPGCDTTCPAWPRPPRRSARPCRSLTEYSIRCVGEQMVASGRRRAGFGGLEQATASRVSAIRMTRGD